MFKSYFFLPWSKKTQKQTTTKKTCTAPLTNTLYKRLRTFFFFLVIIRSTPGQQNHSSPNNPYFILEAANLTPGNTQRGRWDLPSSASGWWIEVLQVQTGLYFTKPCDTEHQFCVCPLRIDSLTPAHNAVDSEQCLRLQAKAPVNEFKPGPLRRHTQCSISNSLYGPFPHISVLFYFCFLFLFFPLLLLESLIFLLSDILMRERQRGRVPPRPPAAQAMGISPNAQTGSTTCGNKACWESVNGTAQKSELVWLYVRV